MISELCWEIKINGLCDFRHLLCPFRQRIINQPIINSDAFSAYPEAVERYFVHYGQIVKSYAGEPPKDAARRYSPGYVVGVETRVVLIRTAPSV